MSETKDDIAAERDALRAENEKLRGQLAAAGATRVAQPAHTFQLSEGDRQQLEISGVVNIGGRLMTTAEVREALGESQRGVLIKDAPAETTLNPTQLPELTGPGVRGIDYVYPSVERGKIDPKLAGTPGIAGPPADEK